MKKMALLLPFAALVATSAVYAESGQALSDKYKCGACHKVDGKAMGPSYRDIAKKNAGDPGAPAHLAKDIKNGSRGTWGPVPMPPQNVPDEDIKIIVDYILSLK